MLTILYMLYHTRISGSGDTGARVFATEKIMIIFRFVVSFKYLGIKDNIK